MVCRLYADWIMSLENKKIKRSKIYHVIDYAWG
jgi:hypothetical protein